jgi:hypothetical protein
VPLDEIYEDSSSNADRRPPARARATTIGSGHAAKALAAEVAARQRKTPASKKKIPTVFRYTSDPSKGSPEKVFIAGEKAIKFRRGFN